MTSTNDHSATTGPTAASGQSGPSAHDATELLRAWTTTGGQLFDRERATREGRNYATGRDVVAAAIGTLDWLLQPAGGRHRADPGVPGGVERLGDRSRRRT